MFKNLLIYRIGAEWQPDLPAAEAALAAQPFTPCGASQPHSSGWVPPRGAAHGPLIESVAGQWHLKLKTEAKLLPASVVKRRAEELAAAIEQDTGRKPGRKQVKDLREQAAFELLPQAFTRDALMRVWLDPKAHWLMLDCASAKRAEEAVSLLVKALPGLVLSPVQTQMSPAAAMALWLSSDTAPHGFSVDRDCELKSADELKSAVRYARHALDIDEVRAHIQAGKQPTRLALTWQGRLSFVLTDAWQIKRLAFDDVVFESTREAQLSADEAFDADAALFTGELRQWWPELLEALGGELAPGALPSQEPVAVAALVPQPAGASASTAPVQPDDDSPPWA